MCLNVHTKYYSANKVIGEVSLVPRPFFAGEEKRAWYNLFAHARDSQEKLGIRIRVDILRVLARSLPLYSRICTTDDG